METFFRDEHHMQDYLIKHADELENKLSLMLGKRVSFLQSEFPLYYPTGRFYKRCDLAFLTDEMNLVLVELKYPIARSNALSQVLSYKEMACCYKNITNAIAVIISPQFTDPLLFNICEYDNVYGYDLQDWFCSKEYPHNEMRIFEDYSDGARILSDHVEQMVKVSRHGRA